MEKEVQQELSQSKEKVILLENLYQKVSKLTGEKHIENSTSFLLSFNDYEIWKNELKKLRLNEFLDVINRSLGDMAEIQISPPIVTPYRPDRSEEKDFQITFWAELIPTKKYEPHGTILNCLKDPDKVLTADQGFTLMVFPPELTFISPSSRVDIQEGPNEIKRFTKIIDQLIHRKPSENELRGFDVLTSKNLIKVKI